MKHLTEEELTLHHYGEMKDRALLAHVESCKQCQLQAQQLHATLKQVPVVSVPELEDEYESQLWFKLRDQLPERKPSFWRMLSDLRVRNWAVAGAMAVLLVAAFLAGRHWQSGQISNFPNESASNNKPQVDRLVALTVGSHLESSQILLIEVMTQMPQDKKDFSAEQGRARELLDANRLYRVSAARGKDPAVQHTLDELERVLVEIANSPSEMQSSDVERLQKMIENQGLLFKVRVIGSKMRQQGTRPTGEQQGRKL
jgi:hypothetical protein